MIKKKYVRIPSEYQEIEYLRNDANYGSASVIYTDYTPVQSTEMFIKFKFFRNQSSDMDTYPGMIFEQTKSNGQGGNWGITLDKPNFKMGFACGQRNGIITAVPIELNKTYYIQLGWNKVVINGENQTITNPSTEFITLGGPLYIWRRHADDSDFYYSKCVYDLYGLSFYENGVKVREFVPCYRKSDNVPGLYETVRGNFFTNAEQRQFYTGSNVSDQKTVKQIMTKVNGTMTPIEYIKTKVNESMVDIYNAKR